MTTYARRLGLFSATMAVIGGIIGGGIFRTPAAVAQRTGSASLALITWGVGGVIALIGAFCFGELGQRKPKAGGSYVYLRDAFGPLAAFLNAWAQLLIMLPGGTAAVAVVFASYAVPLLGLPPAATVPLAVGAIVFVSGVNYVGVKPASVMQNVFVILKLAALAILIVVGLTVAVPYRPLPSPAVTVGGLGVGIALGAALVPVLFTYGGWQNTNLIAEEIIEPERNLPRALVLGVLGVVVVYVLANITYLRLLSAPGLAASTAPAADAMREALGPRGASLIGAGIAVSAFGFLNLNTLVAPRMFQAMAQDGLLFRRMAELHPRYRTPTAAILAFSGWTIVLTLSGTFNQLVDYVVFGDWIFFALAVATLFVYRRRDELAGVSGSGFRVPGYPLLPAVFVLAALYVVSSSVGANPRNAAIGTGLLLLGIPVYGALRHR
ncbi:MAG TPA: amino acid permease [Gemmatimonadales bacterium]|nr:amino acid permease [Gemmatimonadales bacterium]